MICTIKFTGCLLLAFIVWAVGTTQTFAQTIPSSRTVNWSLAGIPGGIPYRTNIFVNVLTTTNPSYKCIGNGVADDSVAIGNALAACPSNEVVYLPTANYCFSNRIYSAAPIGWTLRGDGPGKTVIIDNSASGDLFSFGSLIGKGNGGDNFLGTNNVFALSGGYTKGSTNLTTRVGTQNQITLLPGMLMQISESNDWFVTSIGQNGQNLFSGITADGQHCLDQMVQITAVSNGTNLTIWPPLCWTYSNSLAPVLYVQDFSQATGGYAVKGVPRQIGFENFTITNNLGAASEKHVFDMYCPVQCWWTNVECVNEKNYCLGFIDSGLQCQIDHCWIHATSTNYIYYQDYDLETEFTSYSLIQNCIFDGFFEGVQLDSGSSGNVLAYNLFTNYFNSAAILNDQGRLAPGISVSHGAYPMMNLVEGNVGYGMQADFYWGSSGYDTIFRNRFTSTDTQWTAYPLDDIIALKLDASNLWDNVYGNVLGSPSVTYSAQKMSGQQGYQYSVVNRFGYPYIDADGYTGTNSGTQSLDTNVWATMLYSNNFDYFTGTIVNPVSGLASSMYQASKPSWFGNCPWPAFDPSNPTVSVTNIPAAYRYIYGSDPVSGPVISVTPLSENFGSIGIGVTTNLTFTVQNTGSGTLTGTASVAASFNIVGVAGPFSIVSGGSYSLGAGQSQTVTVSYTPTTAGATSQTITFSGGTGASVTLTGMAGIPAPANLQAQ